MPPPGATAERHKVGLAGALIAAQSTGTYICPANTCVTMPVTIAGNAAPQVLGYSVTFQLSPELALCSGTVSVVEGDFLSAGSSTLYQVVDNLDGTYTVDDVVAGGCGAVGASGTLFTIGVKSAVAGGTGTVTVTTVKMRDCQNQALGVVAGPPATVPIDNQAPVVMVTSPNGGESWAVGSSQTITWTATDNTGVASVDIAYSTDGGATYPNVIAAGVPNTGAYPWTVPGPLTTQALIRVEAHDVACSGAADASDANFTIRSPQIVASAGPNGTINPSGTVPVAYGGSQAFTITPAACSGIADVRVDGVTVGPVAAYAFANVQADHTILATFAPSGPYTITASAGPNGTISPSGAVGVSCGASEAFAIAAASGYHIVDLVVDGISQGPLAAYTFTNVTANHTIVASFAPGSATIGAQSTVTPICPTNSCVTLPVTIAGNVMTQILGYSVTFQLSPELTLCSGPGSVVEGDFLNAGGSTLYQVVDNLDGTYTVDDVVAGGCGPVGTSGTLFSVAVKSALPSGTGTVTVTTVKLRDCLNQALAVFVGPPGTVPIYNPTVTVSSPGAGIVWNIGALHNITWIATDNTGVTSVDIAYSTDGGSTYPHVIATGVPNSGSYPWTVTGPASNNARVRVSGHGVACWSGATNLFTIDGSIATVVTELDAETIDLGVRIQWQLASPDLFASVELQRSPAEAGPWSVLDVDLSVDAGLTVALDRTAEPGQTYFYRLVGTTGAGARAVFGPVKGTASSLKEFALGAAWPNPTPGALTLQFTLSRDAQLELSVLDLQGREVAMLTQGDYRAGRYKVQWDGQTGRHAVAPGLYYIRMSAADRQIVSRVVIAR